MADYKVFVIALVAALVAGVAAGAKAIASSAVQDAYKRWRERATSGDREERVRPYRTAAWATVPAGYQARPMLDRLLPPETTGPTARMTTLSGPAGVGKTQLAARVARDLAGTGATIMWVDARSRRAIVSAYAGALAGFPEAASSDDEEVAAALLLKVLATTAHPWLVVLDDVVAPDDLEGLVPAVGRAGHVIVTTRRRDAALDGFERPIVEVGVFTAAEALAFLDSRLRGIGDRPGARAKLAAALGHLPQALAFAANVIRDEAIDCSLYRQRLRRRVTPGRDVVAGDLFDRQFEAMTASWLAPVRRGVDVPLTDPSPAVLDVASVLDYCGIPDCVLKTPAVSAWLMCHKYSDSVAFNAARMYGVLRMLSIVDQQSSSSECRPGPFGQAVYCVVRALKGLLDSLDGSGSSSVHQAVRRLHVLGVLQHMPGDRLRSVRMHPLAQRVVQRGFVPGCRSLVVRVAADALLDAWPKSASDRKLALALQRNARSLVFRFGPLLWTESGPHPLLYRLGHSYGETGQAFAAAKYFRRLTQRAEARLGAQHSETRCLRAEAAHWLGETGQPHRALRQLERVLRELPGTADPREVLWIRHRHAYWLGMVDPLKAIDAFRVLLADQEREFRPGHTLCQSTRNNLASLRGRVGDPAGAAQEFGPVIAAWESTVGEHHPVTLAARSSRAHWLSRAGDPVAAIALLEPLCRESGRVLGADSIGTLLVRQSLAQTHGEAGDVDEARAGLERLGPDNRRVFGPEHPHTRRNEERLAYWRAAAR
jgi:hypothetical protein